MTKARGIIKAERGHDIVFQTQGQYPWILSNHGS